MGKIVIKRNFKFGKSSFDPDVNSLSKLIVAVIFLLVWAILGITKTLKELLCNSKKK